MIQAIWSRVGGVVAMAVAVVIALVTGLALGLRLVVLSAIDGRITQPEQVQIEKVTWQGAWAALRKIPGLRVE